MGCDQFMYQGSHEQNGHQCHFVPSVPFPFKLFIKIPMGNRPRTNPLTINIANHLRTCSLNNFFSMDDL